MLPGIIIAGAPKCGTSSVFRWLADHPQITTASVKETAYFVDQNSHIFNPKSNFISGGIAGYESMFAPVKKDARLAVEATPAYLYSALALAELPRLASQPHLIFIVREPLSQLRSMYGYFRSNWDWIPHDMTFEQFIRCSIAKEDVFRGNELARDAVHNAVYIDYLAKWLAACGGSRVHVFVFEEVFADLRAFMANICQMFGLASSFYQTYSFPIENATYSVRSAALQHVNIALRPLIPEGAVRSWIRRGYRSVNTRRPSETPGLSAGLRDELREFYAAPNIRLSEAFGLDISRWR